MPTGLQIWDSNGNIIIDTTSRIVRHIGAVGTGTTNGSINVPQFAEGTGYCTIAYGNGVPEAATFGTPIVTISGTTLSWEFRSGNTPAAVILLYGVY